VELLAQAAAKATPPGRPDLVDESRLCGSPGKIVDVGILEQLLKLPSDHQLFYGPGTSNALPLSVLPGLPLIQTSGFRWKFSHALESRFYMRNANLLALFCVVRLSFSTTLDVRPKMSKIFLILHLHRTLLKLTPNPSVPVFAADCNQSRFPDPRDFRIAIVECAPEVRLRIGFLSPALAGSRSEDVEVKLVLAVGCVGWPQSSDFPVRAPLGHIDCLLFQKAAQTVG
jgi:hypothetical protein